jgi:hypothetical protein
MKCIAGFLRLKFWYKSQVGLKLKPYFNLVNQQLGLTDKKCNSIREKLISTLFVEIKGELDKGKNCAIWKLETKNLSGLILLGT